MTSPPQTAFRRLQRADLQCARAERMQLCLSRVVKMAQGARKYTIANNRFLRAWQVIIAQAPHWNTMNPVAKPLPVNMLSVCGFVALLAENEDSAIWISIKCGVHSIILVEVNRAGCTGDRYDR